MIQERLVEYEHHGISLEGFLAHDDGADRGAVMIAHAWAGRSEFEIDKARRLAAAGYIGFAIDLYGKGVLGKDKEENAQLMQPFIDNRTLLRARLRACLAALQDQPQVKADRIAIMGYCFGGLCALDMARAGAGIRAAVSFHGLLMPPPDAPANAITAKVLVLNGAADPMVTTDSIIALQEELTQAGADWQLHNYGHAMHSFTNPQANDAEFGTVYNEPADRRSWQAMLNFLAETL